MNRQSYMMGIFLALFTLIMVIALPIIMSRPNPATESIAAPPMSPYMRALDNQRTALIRVDGGTYFRGTLPDEAESAMQLCAENGWQCDVSLAEDSYPPHQLYVETFWMEMNEVTYEQYVSFLNTLGPGGHLDGCIGHACVLTQTEARTSSIVFNEAHYTTSNPAVNDYPVVDVTWYGAQAYCEALGRRLPTEAEWEYAARGPAGSLYPWGNEWTFEAANVRGSSQNRDGVIIAEPQPVGGNNEYASRDGLRDLAGNVSEWVLDWYDPNHYMLLDATMDLGPNMGTERVIRGGSWNQSPFFARSVQRQHMLPQATSNSVGFRCVAD